MRGQGGAADRRRSEEPHITPIVESPRGDPSARGERGKEEAQKKNSSLFMYKLPRSGLGRFFLDFPPSLCSLQICLYRVELTGVSTRLSLDSRVL